MAERIGPQVGSAERLEAVELPPFQAAFAAGAELVMMGHYLVPALTGSHDLPTSASERAIDGFVRSEMGFQGLVITDALDMGALDQGPAQVVEIITMMRGGTDLLLCMPDPVLQERVRVAVPLGPASMSFTEGERVDPGVILEAVNESRAELSQWLPWCTPLRGRRQTRRRVGESRAADQPDAATRLSGTQCGGSG